MQQGKHRPLFFALWPDEEVRRQLQQLLSQPPFAKVEGRAVDAENFHITLRYLGVLSSPQRLCAERVADAVGFESFRLVLDRVGYWRSPRVAWLGPSKTPVALRQLATRLEQGVVACGLEPEERAFQPHLTCLRKARPWPRDIDFPAITWQVDHFVLARSAVVREGVRYDVLRSWRG